MAQTTFSPSSPIYQGRVGGYPGGATFTDPTKIYILSPLTVHWVEGDQTYTFGSGFAIPPVSTGGGTFWITVSDVGRTGTAAVWVDADPARWQQDGNDFVCLGIIQVYVTPSGFAFSVFGASGVNHSTGLVPDPGSSAGATKFLREDATFQVPVIAAGSVTEADLLIADNVTANVSITAHGFAPKAPNDVKKMLDGTGAYSIPGSVNLKTPLTTNVNTNTDNRGALTLVSGTVSYTFTGTYATLRSWSYHRLRLCLCLLLWL